MVQEFGHLDRVELRTAWSREDTDFTPWLAAEKNLRLLGGTIGIELELQAQEQAVGPYRADLFCTDTVTGARVLIENQIERTDHGHLGQILTYAAGLDAVTVVWIAARFTEEHRAALDWLNQISHEEIRFFGLEVELWRIGDSPPAPKFNVIAKPNDWSKVVRDTAAAQAGPTTEAQQRNIKFWSGFLAHLSDNGSKITSNRKPGSENWMDWGVGRGGFAILVSLSSWTKSAVAQLAVRPPAEPAHYHLLEAERAAIEAEFGAPLQWDFQAGRKQNYIGTSLPVEDVDDPEGWARVYSWLQTTIEKLDQVFRAKVPKLDSSVWTEEDASPTAEEGEASVLTDA
jgi:hypothetical protein